MGQGRSGVEVGMFGIKNQGDLRRHQLPHFPQQVETHGPQGLIKTQARLEGTDVVRGLLDHRLDPTARLGEERTGASAAMAVPALQHLRIGIQPGDQQRLAAGDRFGELEEEGHAMAGPGTDGQGKGPGWHGCRRGWAPKRQPPSGSPVSMSLEGPRGPSARGGTIGMGSSPSRRAPADGEPIPNGSACLWANQPRRMGSPVQPSLAKQAG